MKWFKHLSGSGDDQLIMDSISIFGPDAYYFYFRILEIMSDEFDVKNPGTNTFLIKTLRKKLQISIKKMKKIAKFFHEKNRIFYSENLTPRNPSVTFKCPKLKELCDEYTTKQLSKMSGVNRELIGIQVGSHSDTEAEAEADTSLSSDTSVSSDKQPSVAHSEQKSGHFLEKIVDENLVLEIKETCMAIDDNETLQAKNFSGWEFMQKNSNTHPIARLCVLKKILKQAKIIKSPWAYGNKVLRIESQNYDERDSIQGHEIMKRLFAKLFPFEAKLD